MYRIYILRGILTHLICVFIMNTYMSIIHTHTRKHARTHAHPYTYTLTCTELHTYLEPPAWEAPAARAADD